MRVWEWVTWFVILLKKQDIHMKQDFNQIMIKVHYFSCLSQSN